MLRITNPSFIWPGPQHSSKPGHWEECQLSQMRNGYLDSTFEVSIYEQRTETLDDKAMMSQRPAEITIVNAQRTSTFSNAAVYNNAVPSNNLHERNLNNDCHGEVTRNEGNPYVFSNMVERSVPQAEPNRNPEPASNNVVSHIEANVQLDMVDGDEPGIVMDPELERLTQPHVLMAQPRYQRFSDPEVRRQTFMSWRNLFPSVQCLVLSGFFFLGGKDNVQCFHCGIILHSWEETDVPDDEHRRHSPGCIFMKQKARSGMPHENPGVRRPPTAQTCQQRTPVDHNAVLKNTVAGMGHSMATIESALKKLKLKGDQNPTSAKLLDTVFDLENFEDRNVTEDVHGTRPDWGGATGGVEISSTAAEPSVIEKILVETSTSDQHSSEQLSQSNEQGYMEKASKLEKENEELKKQTTCRVCWENPSTELFLPCGHLACCENCSGRLRECPYCRQKILRTVHVFLP